MAAHFSYEIGEATIVCALQQHEMRKVCVSSTTHERTPEKLHGSDAALPFSVQGGWE